MKYLNNFDCYINPMKPLNTIFESNFSFNPKNIHYTFCTLTQNLYPYGTESEVLKWIDYPLQQDEFNNYFIKIGESNTMFTSHFDSATSKQQKVNLFEYKKDGDTFITTDGKTILGADDKAGVTIMLYMIEHNIPGLYYFFVGEEMGGIGSSELAISNSPILSGINKCVSFDRRGYESIITHQMYESCCTDKFAESLIEAFDEQGMKFKKDDTGIFTDSAHFIGVIDECTNISVGYFKEHTKQEYQNITYLETLCKACTNINWDNLMVKNKKNI